MTERNYPDFLTVAETADLTRLSIGNLNRRRCLRQGPPYLKVGTLVRYSRQSVIEWMAAQSVKVRD